MGVSTATLKMIMEAEDRASGIIKGVGGTIGGVMANIAKVAVAGFATAGAAAIGFTAKAVTMGSDAEESLSKFQAVFGPFADQYQSAFEEMGSALNRNKFDLIEWAGNLQDTFVPMGFAREQAASMTEELVQLSVDVASFSNKLEADVIRDFQSALVGNTETVRKYGIVITQVSLDAELLRMGIEGGVNAATEQQKVMARMNLIMAGTTDAQGDAARTANSWSNQMRGLKATISETVTEIGVKLLPVVTPLLAKIGELAKTWLPILADMFLNKVVPAIQSFWNIFQLLLTGDFQGGIFGFTEDSPFIGFLFTARELVQKFVDWIGKIDFAALWTKFETFIFDASDAINEFKDEVLANAQEKLQGFRDWWDEHGPGIETAAKQMIQTVKDTFNELAADAIPFAIEELDKFKVWFDDNGPLIEESAGKIGDFFQNVVGPKIVEAWRTIIKPALAAFLENIRLIGSFILNVFTGNWEDAWQNIKDILSNNVEGIKEALTGLINWFLGFFNTNLDDAVQSWIGTLDIAGQVVDKLGLPVAHLRDNLQRLADKLFSLKLPDWLTPGSPTPLETGLIGIRKAMQGVSGSAISGLNSGLGKLQGSPIGGGAGFGGAGGRNLIVQVKLEIKPAVAVIDQNEAKRKIVPLIEGAVRDIIKKVDLGGGSKNAV